jgi:hypothetical protein
MNYIHIAAYFLKAKSAKLAETDISSQQLQNKEQWSKWKAVISTWSMLTAM